MKKKRSIKRNYRLWCAVEIVTLRFVALAIEYFYRKFSVEHNSN